MTEQEVVVRMRKFVLFLFVFGVELDPGHPLPKLRHGLGHRLITVTPELFQTWTPSLYCQPGLPWT